jgi:hypothetical protein
LRLIDPFDLKEPDTTPDVILEPTGSAESTEGRIEVVDLAAERRARVFEGEGHEANTIELPDGGKNVATDDESVGVHTEWAPSDVTPRAVHPNLMGNTMPNEPREGPAAEERGRPVGPGELIPRLEVAEDSVVPGLHAGYQEGPV